MHPDQLDVDDALASRLVAEGFPELGGLRLARLHTAGTVNTIVRIGEAEALAELADATAVPAPRPYGVRGGGADYASAWSVNVTVMNL